MMGVTDGGELISLSVAKNNKMHLTLPLSLSPLKDEVYYPPGTSAYGYVG